MAPLTTCVVALYRQVRRERQSFLQQKAPADIQRLNQCRHLHVAVLGAIPISNQIQFTQAVNYHTLAMQGWSPIAIPKFASSLQSPRFDLAQCLVPE